MISNENLQAVLVIMGVPKEVFSMVDPVAILMAYVFSTRIFIMILSIIIWLGIFLFKSPSGISVKNQSKTREELSEEYSYDIKNPFKAGRGKKRQNNQLKVSKTHNYIAKDPFKMEKAKKPSLLGMVMRGVIVPIIVIYVALSVSVSVFNHVQM